METASKSTMNSEQQSREHQPSGKATWGQRLANNKGLQLFEIATVFSPVVLVVIAFRMTRLNDPMLLVGAVWVANVLMLGLIWTGIRIRVESWRSIGLPFGYPRMGDVGWSFLKSIPIFLFAIGAFILGTVVMANIVGVPDGADMTKYNYLRGNLPMLLISLAGVYIVSSFGEEVVYRGFLITRLEPLFGGRSGTALSWVVIASSIIFGFAHFEWGAMGIVQPTCMGAALGIAFLLCKRNLWPLVLAHGYMDTLLLTQLYLAPESVS